MSATESNPFLRRNLAPVTTRVTAHDVRVTRNVPAEQLAGGQKLFAANTNVIQHAGRALALLEARSDQKSFGHGEPVFVPREGATTQDDGFVMALRQNLARELSELANFDARASTVHPVDLEHLPARMPNGFRGNGIIATK